MDIDFYFDTACPWCWITSRWISEVAPERDLNVRWRTFSLKFKNEGNEIPEQFVEPMANAHRSLRVIESARAKEGDGVVGDLYTEYGRRIHHDGDGSVDHVAVLEAVGVDPVHADAADDESFDEVIRASMGDGLELAGDDIGVPLIAFPAPGQGDSGQGGGGQTAYFGPVISPAPTGDAALRLWDGLATMATTTGFYELKRTRGVGPQFGPRP